MGRKKKTTVEEEFEGMGNDDSSGDADVAASFTIPQSSRDSRPAKVSIQSDASTAHGILERITGKNMETGEELPFDELLTNPQNEIIVERTAPQRYNGESVTGEVMRIPCPTGLNEIRRQIEEEFGGKEYRVVVVKRGDSDPINRNAAKRLRVDRDPIIQESIVGDFLKNNSDEVTEDDKEILELEREIAAEKRRQKLEELKGRHAKVGGNGADTDKVVRDNDAKWERRMAEKDREMETRLREMETNRRIDDLKASQEQQIRNMTEAMTRTVGELKSGFEKTLESIKESMSPKEDRTIEILLKQMDLEKAKIETQIQQGTQSNEMILRILSEQNSNLMKIMEGKNGGMNGVEAAKEILGIALNAKELTGDAGGGMSIEGAIAQSLPKAIELLAAGAQKGANMQEQLQHAAVQIAADVKAHSAKVIRDEISRMGVNPARAGVQQQVQTQPQAQQRVQPQEQPQTPVQSEVDTIIHRRHVVNRVIELIVRELPTKPENPQWVDVAWDELPEDLLEKIVFAGTDEEVVNAMRNECDVAVSVSLADKIKSDAGAQDFIVKSVGILKQYYREAQQQNAAKGDENVEE